VNSGTNMAKSGTSSALPGIFGARRCREPRPPVHSDPVPEVVGTAARSALLQGSACPGEIMPSSVMSGLS
jgi:hypothetical protein